MIGSTPPIDVTAMRELLAKATPGPWQVNPEYRTFISTASGDADIAELDGWPLDLMAEEDANRGIIIAAINALPTLLTAYEQSAAMREALVTTLDALESFGREANWGASALSGETIAKVNAALGIARAALNGEPRK